MKAKLKFLANVESLLNTFARPLGLRILLVQESALHQCPISYRSDGLISSHHVNFKDDNRFDSTLKFVRSQVAHSVYHEYRIYNAIQLAGYASTVPDSIFVECGVGEGILTLSILHYHVGIKNPIYLFDTFSGIDPALLLPEELAKSGLSAEQHSKMKLRSYRLSSFDAVSQRFAPYPSVKLIPGSVPSVLQNNLALLNRISYLHIDMNNATPEREALTLLYERVTVPGFILFDDYGFEGMSPQRIAVNAACHELGIGIPMSLPTGQGLIIKTAMRGHA
jgi:hypothetical protein